MNDDPYDQSEEVWPGIVVDFDKGGRPIALDFTDNASTFVDVEGLEAGSWRRVTSPSARDDAPMISGRELRRRREALGMTQAALGATLNVAPNTIARWERGVLTIENPRLLALAIEGLASKRPAGSMKRPAAARTTGSPAVSRPVRVMKNGVRSAAMVRQARSGRVGSPTASARSVARRATTFTARKK